jgi:hypothetical protein
MRRVHLRGHENILKRVLLQAGAFNLGLLMRQLVGIGTPRRLQGRSLAVLACLWSVLPSAARLWAAIGTLFQPFAPPDHLRAPRRDDRIDLTVTTTALIRTSTTGPSRSASRNTCRAATVRAGSASSDSNNG